MTTTTIKLIRNRGNYIAHLTGLGGKYGIIREFLKAQQTRTPDGAKVGEPSATITEPGIYERRQGDTKQWWLYDGHGLVPLGVDTNPDTAQHSPNEQLKTYLHRFLNGPDQTEPGCWFGLECECRRPVAFYDPDGFPKCEECQQ